MVFKANASVAFKMDSTQMIGFEWSQKDGTQDISEAPVTSINFKLSGSIYLGFDMAPKAELGVGKVSLVKLKFKAEAGFELLQKSDWEIRGQVWMKFMAVKIAMRENWNLK